MTIRDFIPGKDEGLLLSLRAAVWGEDHSHNNSDFFSWLFETNPDGHGGGVLSEECGEAFGFAGLATRSLMCQGNQVTIAMGMDYMIHPEHRNGFAATRLVNSWIKSVSDNVRDYDFALCFPNDNSYKILTGKKLGWQPIFQLTMLTRPIGSVSELPGKLACVPSWILAPGFRTLSLLCTLRTVILNRHRLGGKAVEITHFDARFDRLWDLAGVTMGSVRNADHLNWRYKEHPLYQYKTFAWIDDEQVLGYIIVTQREAFNIPSLLIVDVLSDSGSSGVVEALTITVADYARSIGASMLCTQVIKGSTLNAAFSRSGMIAVPKQLAPKSFALTAHGLGRPLPALDVDSWHFTWGDMDVV